MGGGRGGEVGGGTVGGGGGGEVGGDKNLSESVIGEGNADRRRVMWGSIAVLNKVPQNAFSICKSHFLLTYYVKLEIFLPLGKKLIPEQNKITARRALILHI